LEKANTIEGWLYKEERDILYNTVSLLNDVGCIVEIGSWCGKSLTVLTAAALAKSFQNKIYSIDPFVTSQNEPNGKYEVFVKNLKDNGIFERITHIKEKSQIVGESFSENIEFIFIDGFHKYSAVTADFELYYKNVVEKGFIAIHDVFSFYGPTQLIADVLSVNKNIKFVKHSNSLVLFQKVPQLTDVEILQNELFCQKVRDFLAENKASLID